MASAADLITTIAYFFIPLQILVTLWKYPRLARMPPKVFVLLVLFALFIFLCGTGHLMRFLDLANTPAFAGVNIATSVVSLITALYLLPLIPFLLGSLDDGLQDLVKLNAETAENNLKLVNFMAFLCHEIRNPLFAITSSVSFLEDTDLTEEQRVGVGSILDSSKLMLRLVNDVLELSKIDAGKLELEDRDFDLRCLLGNLEMNMRMQVSKKHRTAVDFRFSMSADVPRFVRGDSVRILQIIFNLLSNSNKFTSEGHIALLVGVHHKKGGAPSGEATGEASQPSLSPVVIFDESDKHIDGTSVSNELDDHSLSAFDLLDEAEVLVKGTSKKLSSDMVNLSIVVSDTGIGISPERIRMIFEPYSQDKLSDYRKHGGTGLGLSILSSIVKIMGGSIEVWSEVGVGSRFALKLPVKVVPQEEIGDLSASEIDMSDPLGSCRRLPVYGLEDDVQQGRCPPGTSEVRVHRRHPSSTSEVRMHRRHPSSASEARMHRIHPSRMHRRYPSSPSEIRMHRRHPSSSSEIRLHRRHPSSPSEIRTHRRHPSSTSEASQHKRHPSSTLEYHAGTEMMSNQLNSCRRLPVYMLEDGRLPKKPMASSINFPDVPHENAGIEFFESPGTHDSTEGAAAKCGGGGTASEKNHPLFQTVARPAAEAKKRPVKKPKFSKFDLPPGECVILVVDDNCVNRKIIGRMLSLFGVEFEEASDGREAVEAVRRGRDVSGNPSAPRFGLVLMDLSMPVMDGYEAIDTIRKEMAEAEFLPIVALTANALSQERTKALELGADAFHTKPILRDDLYAVCKRYLWLPEGGDVEKEI